MNEEESIPFLEAMRKNDKQEMHIKLDLLSSYPSLINDYYDHNTKTLLYFAIEAKSIEAARLLLEKGSDVNALCYDGVWGNKRKPFTVLDIVNRFDKPLPELHELLKSYNAKTYEELMKEQAMQNKNLGRSATPEETEAFQKKFDYTATKTSIFEQRTTLAKEILASLQSCLNEVNKVGDKTDDIEEELGKAAITVFKITNLQAMSDILKTISEIKL